MNVFTKDSVEIPERFRFPKFRPKPEWGFSKNFPNPTLKSSQGFVGDE